MDSELQARVDAIRDETKRQREIAHEAWLRKWAVEHLLASPAAAGLTTPGWNVETADVAEMISGPGTFLVRHKGPPTITRIPSPLFTLADEMVAYVLTGEHPKNDAPLTPPPP